MKKHELRTLMVSGILLLFPFPALPQNTSTTRDKVISQNDPKPSVTSVTLRAGDTFDVNMLSPDRSNQSGTDYAIQVGAFAVRSNAVKMRGRLVADGFRADIYEDYLNGKDLLYLVWAGSYNSREEAARAMGTIKHAYHIDGLLMVRSGSRKN